MATLVSDILDTDDLLQEVADGYVTLREHSEFPDLVIANYSDKCAFDRHWTKTTRKTRGLIYNKATGEIVARPFEKFFNHGEPDAPQIDLDLQVRVMDKIDGSLGVIFTPDGQQARVATRGSFHSDQADWANAWLDERPHVQEFLLGLMATGATPMVEIVYKDNRIVLEYDTEGLIALGAVRIATGGVFVWNHPEIPAAEHFGDMTYREALEMPPRENAEGLVIQAGTTSDRFVKLKQEDYIQLHRIVSHLTEKEVWRQLRDHTFEEYVQKLPDEFYDWATDVADALKQEAQAHENAVREWHSRLEGETRKDQALWINANVPPQYRGLVFSLLDDKSLEPAITKMVEPRGA